MTRFQALAPILALAMGMSGIALSALPGLAWTPPSVGTNCTGLRGGGEPVVRIAGNYLGGRLIRDGMVDRKSFQACFQSVASCETWLAGHAQAYPLQPGIAQCVPVMLR